MSHVARLRRTGSQNKTNYYNNQLVNHFKPERGVIPELEEDVPSGCIIAYTGAVDPRGWYICDGRVLQIQYNEDLFAVIGTQFGAPDAYTFRLPDLRGSFLRGSGQNATYTDYAGANLKNFQEHATQVHHHGITDPQHNHGITDPQHNHGITDPSHNHNYVTYNDDFNGSGGTGYSQLNANGNVSGGHINKNCSTTDTPSMAGFDSDGYNITWTNAVQPSQTGITVNNASTGITVNNHATGITVNDVISTDTNVSGTTVKLHNKETRPFSLGINWIIKA